MVTNAPDVLEWLAREWEKVIPSAVCSGIVGDSAHQTTASKHNSRQDNPSGTWVTEYPEDRNGPSNMACAIDMSMSEADMKKVHNRFKALYNDKSDPRRKYIYAFNGWDGNGSPGRYNVRKNTISITDNSHKWHEHDETYYQYVGTDDESWKCARAHLSVVKGETGSQWLLSEEDDMTQEEHDALMLVKRLVENCDKYLWKGFTQVDETVEGIQGASGTSTVNNIYATKFLAMIATQNTHTQEISAINQKLDTLITAIGSGGEINVAVATVETGVRNVLKMGVDQEGTG